MITICLSFFFTLRNGCISIFLYLACNIVYGTHSGGFDNKIVFLMFLPKLIEIADTISVITNDGRNIVVSSWYLWSILNTIKSSFYGILVCFSGNPERFWPSYKYNPWWISWTCFLHQGINLFLEEDAKGTKIRNIVIDCILHSCIISHWINDWKNVSWIVSLFYLVILYKLLRYVSIEEVMIWWDTHHLFSFSDRTHHSFPCLDEKKKEISKAKTAMFAFPPFPNSNLFIPPILEEG